MVSTARHQGVRKAGWVALWCASHFLGGFISLALGQAPRAAVESLTDASIGNAVGLISWGLFFGFLSGLAQGSLLHWLNVRTRFWVTASAAAGALAGAVGAAFPLWSPVAPIVAAAIFFGVGQGFALREPGLNVVFGIACWAGWLIGFPILPALFGALVIVWNVSFPPDEVNEEGR